MIFTVLWEEGDTYKSEVGRCSVDFPARKLKGRSHFQAELEICKKMREVYPGIDLKYPKAEPCVIFPKGFFPRR
ncbi:MAG: hypothetical protein WCV68_04355 [Candidatus Paceibacterota bacterium]|jgi:hypothetical protein